MGAPPQPLRGGTRRGGRGPPRTPLFIFQNLISRRNNEPQDFYLGFNYISF